LPPARSVTSAPAEPIAPCSELSSARAALLAPHMELCIFTRRVSCSMHRAPCRHAPSSTLYAPSSSLHAPSAIPPRAKPFSRCAKPASPRPTLFSRPITPTKPQEKGRIPAAPVYLLMTALRLSSWHRVTRLLAPLPRVPPPHG
jgi:hypothetical protein